MYHLFLMNCCCDELTSVMYLSVFCVFLSSSHATPSLQLPLKLLFPYTHSSGAPAFSMLGLGDM